MDHLPTFNHQIHTFPSGLRLVTVPMPSTSTATVLVLVGTGSKYEAKEINGISHFLEHMMFKGTEKRPGYLDISRELDGIGSAYNAFTSKELTGYYAKASSSRIQTLMDVVFDIFLNSTLSAEAIEVERGPVIEELKMREDDPRQDLDRLFEQLLYGDQPAGWEIGGEPETIARLTREQFVDYFKTHYIAKNTVIAVAGDIDPEAIRAEVERQFQHIRQAEAVSKPAVVEAQSGPQVFLKTKDVQQAYVTIGFRAYTMFDDRRYALALLASILGGGMSSRLFDEVREKRGLAYFVSAGQNTYTDSGYFAIEAGLNKDKAIEGIKVILAECAKVRDEGVTAEELQRVKDRAEGLMALSLEHSDGVASDYGQSLLMLGKILTPHEELAKIQAVTQDDIRAVARDILSNDKLNCAVIAPFASDADIRAVIKLS